MGNEASFSTFVAACAAPKTQSTTSGTRRVDRNADEAFRGPWGQEDVVDIRQPLFAGSSDSQPSGEFSVAGAAAKVCLMSMEQAEGNLHPSTFEALQQAPNDFAWLSARPDN